MGYLNDFDENPRWELGRTYMIKTADGVVVETECVTWTDEQRVLKAKNGTGYIDLDWMEYLDQASLGRIELVGLPQ